MIVGIVANTVAAMCFGLSFVLQRKEARVSDAGGVRLVLAMLKRPLWLVGGLAALVGAVLTFYAMQKAPIPVVQPFAAASLVFLVIFARPILGEIPGAREYAGIALTVAGMALGLLTLGREIVLQEISAFSFYVVLVVLGAAVVVFGLVDRRLRDGPRDVALPIALSAGLALGTVTAMFRVIGVWASPAPGDWVPPTSLAVVAIAIVAVVGPIGFVLFQNGLKHHRSTTFIPPYQITVLMTPVLVALVAYGQRLPGGVVVQAVRVASFALVIAGVIVLSMSPQVSEDMAAEPTAETGRP